MTAEGDNRVLMTKVSKEVLSMRERGQFVPPSPAHISHINLIWSDATPNDYLSLFITRENLLFSTLNSNMQSKLQDKKHLLFDIWMYEESDNIQLSAHALGERIALQQFISTVNYHNKETHKTSNTSTKEIFKKLLILYSVVRIEADIGYFLSHNILTPHQSQSLTLYSRSLCAEMAVYSLSLTEAFGVDGYMNTAPILHDWIKYNEIDNKGEINATEYMKE